MKIKGYLKSTHGLVAAALLAGISLQVKAQINTGPNTITGTQTSVAAGRYNTNNADFSLIGGGEFNWIDSGSTWSLLGSGQYNRITGAPDSVIGGGTGNFITEAMGTIGGGADNSLIGSAWCFIGAGEDNQIVYTEHSVIGGGYENLIFEATEWGTIGGGFMNAIYFTEGCTIGGGWINIIGATNNNDYYSTIGGGYRNTIDAKIATIAGGDFNLATGHFSAIAGGMCAKATLYGQFAHANGAFTDAGQGEAQASEYVLRKTTTSTNSTELLLSGETTWAGVGRLTMPTNSTWTFDIQVVARSASGNSGGFKTNGVIKNVSGTLSLNGTSGGSIAAPAIYSDVAGWAVTVSADNSTKALAVFVKGDTSTNRWVATVRTTEVVY